MQPKQAYWTIGSMAALLFLLPASLALAHPGASFFGRPAAHGLVHPFQGWDHWLAMVAVGLWSAQIGGRAVWAVPGSFVGGVVAGFLIIMLGGTLAGVEWGIAASILLLGTALALNRRVPLALPAVLAAVFGCFHGHAHGLEMPSAIGPALYALGFVAATAALHAAGILVGGWAMRSARGAGGLRLSGAAVAAAGICLALIL
jgi:urease accessory protein